LSRNSKHQAKTEGGVSCLLGVCICCCLPLSMGSGVEVAHLWLDLCDAMWCRGSMPYGVEVPYSVEVPHATYGVEVPYSVEVPQRCRGATAMLYGAEVPQSVTRPLLSQNFLHHYHYTPSVVIPSLNHSSLLTFAPLCSSSTSISLCPLFLAKSKAVCPLCTAHKDELSKGCVRVAVRLVYTWI